MLFYFPTYTIVVQPSLASEDLSTGRQFESSSTCGLFGPEDISIPLSPGDVEPYICDATDPERSHSSGSLNDQDDPLNISSRTWWQSESSIEEVSIKLSLGGFYFLGGVRIDFRLPAPSVVVVEASQDFGEKYSPLRYYSDSCELDFNLPSTSLEGAGKTERICTSDFSSSGGDDNIVSDRKGVY